MGISGSGLAVAQNLPGKHKLLEPHPESPLYLCQAQLLCIREIIIPSPVPSHMYKACCKMAIRRQSMVLAFSSVRTTRVSSLETSAGSVVCLPFVTVCSLSLGGPEDSYPESSLWSLGNISVNQESSSHTCLTPLRFVWNSVTLTRALNSLPFHWFHCLCLLKPPPLFFCFTELTVGDACRKVRQNQYFPRKSNPDSRGTPLNSPANTDYQVPRSPGLIKYVLSMCCSIKLFTY